MSSGIRSYSATVPTDAVAVDREWLAALPHQYRVLGLRVDGEFQFGLTARDAESVRPGVLPQAVYERAASLLSERLDVDELADRGETPALLGDCTVTRDDAGTLTVAVELPEG